ncbi:DUF4349 domain-containing protein [Candidatus Bathyarchaeota archaeon]|nr:DUF4349 domain-containing protein [Candidatus Bathyarchaeota archaeon]
MSKARLAAAIAALIIVVAASLTVGTIIIPLQERERLARPESFPAAAPPPITTPSPKTLEYKAPEGRMVIYNGYVSIETDDIEGTLGKVRSLAEGRGGYVAGSSRSTSGTRIVAQITIRIPQEVFHRTMVEIEGYGKVLDEHTTSDDVTERYIDLKSRLKNLQVQEQRLVGLFEKAAKVDEVLQIERELGRVRGEIESLQGQINYLERSVAMSLITVNLITPPPPFTPPGMDWGSTLEAAMRGFFTVLRGLIIIVVSLLPFILIVGLPAYFLYRRRRSRKPEGQKPQNKTA